METDNELKVTKWTSQEPLPEQMRWKISVKTETLYREVEGDSLWGVLRIHFLAWRLDHGLRMWQFKKKISNLGRRLRL